MLINFCFVLWLFKVPPEVWLVNQKLGQYVGKETILECKVTAFPQAVSIWKFQNQDLFNSFKHRIDVYQDRGHMLTLSLRLPNVTREDFGQYSCYASNSFGMDEETMILYGKTLSINALKMVSCCCYLFGSKSNTRSFYGKTLIYKINIISNVFRSCYFIRVKWKDVIKVLIRKSISEFLYEKT